MSVSFETEKQKRRLNEFNQQDNKVLSGIASGKEYICHTCGKGFKRLSSWHQYKRFDKKSKKDICFCSWSCVCRYDETQEKLGKKKRREVC